MIGIVITMTEIEIGIETEIGMLIEKEIEGIDEIEIERGKEIEIEQYMIPLIVQKMMTTMMIVRIAIEIVNVYDYQEIILSQAHLRYHEQFFIEL